MDELDAASEWGKVGTDERGSGPDLLYLVFFLGVCPDLPHLGFGIFEEFIDLSFEFFFGP